MQLESEIDGLKSRTKVL